MYLGRVGTYIAQSVYTVSGPFHPFGGAVDIIVVEQEDGTFKTSPWYVKFGKFQGVLKRTEKQVVVAVNDIDASFHMYLDHKGEAYFLKDAQGDDDDDALAFSPTEAASSGDESSSHVLAPEYPRGDEQVDGRAEHGKEESEDERGDDLELRFEGREASKQLIQQSVEERQTAALAREEIDVAEGNFSYDLEIRERSRDAGPSPNQDEPKTRTENSGVFHRTQGSNRKVRHTLLNKAVGLEADRRSEPARTMVANAALVALKFSSLPDDSSPEEASTKVRKTADRNGMIIHSLLNQAVGLQPSHRSGPAVALLANVALAALRKAVSDAQSDASLNVTHNQAKLMELGEGDSEPEKNESTVPGRLGVEWISESKDQVLIVDSVSDPNAMGLLSSNGNSSDDVRAMNTVSSVDSFSGLESDADELDLNGPFIFGPASPLRSSEILEVTATLDVRKVEIIDDALVVEVQEHVEHVEQDVHGSVARVEEIDIPDTCDRLETLVIDRKQMIHEVHDLQEFSGQDEAGGVIESNDAQKLEAVHEQDITHEAGGVEVLVRIDKRLVENLNDTLTKNNIEGPQMILADEKGTTVPGKEVAVISSEDVKDVCTPKAATASIKLPTASKEVNLISSDHVKDVCSPGVTPACNDLALVHPMNLADVSSPRLKAAIEIEMAWRDVMDKAAITLKGAPYTSKKLNHSQSYNKSLSISGSGQTKPNGRDGLPEQSERKSWGGWFWGGGSTPQSKQTGEQSNSKEQNNVQRESSLEPRVQDLDYNELGDQSGIGREAEDVTKSITRTKQGVLPFEGSERNVEAEGQVALSESDSGPAEDKKAGTENLILTGKLDDQSEFISDVKAAQKAQGGPPAQRRSLFGLLSRSNANQSSLSSASSLQSNDDVQPVLSSLERAESVVDLLEAKWARGTRTHKGPMAITSVPNDRITKENRHSMMEDEAFESKNAGNALNKGFGVNMALTVEDPEQASVDSLKPTLSTVGITLAETAVTQVVVAQDENSTGLTQKCSEGTACVREGDAKDTGGQSVIKVAANGLDKENTLMSVVSDTDPHEFSSTPNTDVMLMSIDGHLLTAPLFDSKVHQASDEVHEKVCDEGEEAKRVTGGRPHQVPCFADIPARRPGFLSDTHPSPNGMQQMQQGKGVGQSEEAGQELERLVGHDGIEGIVAGPGCEGLKELAKLVVFDNVGVCQPTMGSSYAHDSDGLESEIAMNELGCISKGGPSIEINDQGSVNPTDPKEFEEMRAMVFEKLEQEEGDGLDLNVGGLERYYSSKDLEIGDDGERGLLKQNMSLYMDAIRGEDGSVLEDDIGQSRDQSSPIEIPGAQERTRNFPPSNDMHVMRTASESLPNATRHMVNSEMASPRLILSRSLDSAPPPSILPPERREQSASFDGVLAVRSEGEGVIVAERSTVKVSRESENMGEVTHEPCAQSRSTGSSSTSVDDRGKGPETGFELSLCRHLLMERMGLEAAAQAFATERVTLDDFTTSGSVISANDKLIVRVGGRYYPWVVAAPIVLGILAFGQVLIAPNEGAIAVEQPIVVSDGIVAASTMTTISSGGWKLWPFGGIRRPKTPEKGNAAALVSSDALIVATEAALKSNLTNEYLRMAGYYKRPRKVRTNSPSSHQLASLNLKEGSNKITFTFVTRMLGKQQVDARIYLWKWNARIVISDVDGTITRSDVLGQVMPLVGKDWTQSGVARLFSAIKKNGYELMFLSARAISQAYLTRQFLENIKQDGEVLPDGPVVISPDGLFPSLYREVIRRAPHEFKIACLEDIKSLFPPQSKPFYAGFGNRDTDELSYLKVGISKGKIFIINPKGEVVVNNRVDVKSYTSLHKLVDDMFPAMTFTEQEDYNEWNFWKLPLPDIEDVPNVKR